MSAVVHEVYETRLGDLSAYFRVRIPVQAGMQALRKSHFAVPNTDRSRIPTSQTEDAFILSLQRTPFSGHTLRFEARLVTVVPFPQGMMSLVNLALDPTTYSGSDVDSCSFYLHRGSFDRLADEVGGSRIDDLAIGLGAALNDPVLVNLGCCLLPSIERPEEGEAPFIDHIASALHAHLAQSYGGMRIPRTAVSGSLAPWQLRLARDTINASLDTNISLAQIASRCGLSVSHFARAFASSTGLSPHRWLVQRRVERAKDLMRTRSSPLADVALACGFSDQCHFTRVFSRATGKTPSQWRRIKGARVLSRYLERADRSVESE